MTKESLDLFRDILENYGEEYSQEWLDKSKESMLRTMCGAFETPNAQLNMLRTIALFDLPDDYVKQREQTLKSITLEEAKQIIEKYMNFNRMTIVIVGDAASQLENVRSLGFEPIVIRLNEPIEQ